MKIYKITEASEYISVEDMQKIVDVNEKLVKELKDAKDWTDTRWLPWIDETYTWQKHRYDSMWFTLWYNGL